MSTKNNLLFITSSCLGDAVLTSGLLKHLVDNVPQLSVTLACGAVPAPLFVATPGLKNLHVIHKRTYGRHWAALWKKTCLEKWTHIVDLRGTGVSLFLRCGKNRWIWRGGGDGHQVERLGRLMQLSPPPDPQLWTQPFHEEEAEKMLADRGEIIVFAPASNWPPKTWPVDSWKTLGEKLLSPQGLFPGATLLLMGARHERSILEAVAHGVGEKKCILGAGDVHLLTLYACLKRARVFVGNDSGLMHLAAASGVPTVGLFGPTPSRQYRPWGKRTAVAHCPEAQVLLKERAFRNPQESVMGKLMPEVVLEKIAGLL